MSLPARLSELQHVASELGSVRIRGARSQPRLESLAVGGDVKAQLPMASNILFLISDGTWLLSRQRVAAQC